MAIPRDFINDLVARTDIVELIDSKVPLKKAGKNYSACCPFHGEKTPSFTVSQDKQFYHCFGCGMHGNVIDFLLEYDRLGFVDAIEELASMHGLQVPQEEGAPNKNHLKQSKDYYDLMEQTAKRYQDHLNTHPTKNLVNDYLEMRGLSNHIIEKFRIGFAIDSWDDVLALHRNDNTNQSKLVETGVLIKNDNGRIYDRFRQRLMFPIRDRRGRVVGFGGRVLDDSTPKYLNSPETPIFHKGKELYGLYELKQAYRNPPKALVVEGYMDVVALAQFGVDYAVASLGTSTTADQLQLLLRTAKEIIFCYDGDKAGKEAAWRALETALPLLKPGDRLRFMFLPDGEDPDSYVRQQGKQAFEQQQENAQELIGFLFDTLLQSNRIDDGSLAKAALKLIEKVQDKVLQETLLDGLAHRLRMNSSEELKKKFGFHAVSANPIKAETLKGRGTPLRLALALLIQYPQLGYQLPNQAALQQLSMPGVDLLIKLLNLTAAQSLNSAQLLEHFRDEPQFETLAKLAKWEHLVADDKLQIEFKKALLWLNNQYLEERLSQLQDLSTRQQLTAAQRQQLKQLLQILKG
ncbi:DNA primase [Paraferrimonas sp. SM1919]|uniref:DNA primase n=1 Tax=Paraferrimonas sp. SM1919 TaxID=2662263 RepID=UPI0013D5A200|nr:DNA primase [Paraferrimonas sp. SM1919]